MPLLFCHIAWMREYKGHHRAGGQEDPPQRGGRYVDEHGEAHECCNFLPGENGVVYGHVETWRGGEDGFDAQIKIENLGANSDDSIDGIDVIWTATHQMGGKRVVGWYRNARVYRNRHRHGNRYPTNQHRRDHVDSYRITAAQEDAHLIPENKRNLLLDKAKKRKGWPGENSVFYPGNHEDNQELTQFLEELTLQIQEETERGLTFSDPSEEYCDVEGRLRLKRHVTKERSGRLIRAFKSQLTDYSCSVCGFSFERIYGELGRGFIEAHHTTPIAALTEQTIMSVSDLIAVCSNCHRMLHRSNSPLSAKDLKSAIKSQRSPDGAKRL